MKPIIVIPPLDTTIEASATERLVEYLEFGEDPREEFLQGERRKVGW